MATTSEANLAEIEDTMAYHFSHSKAACPCLSCLFFVIRCVGHRDPTNENVEEIGRGTLDVRMES